MEDGGAKAKTGHKSRAQAPNEIRIYRTVYGYVRDTYVFRTRELIRDGLAREDGTNEFWSGLHRSRHVEMFCRRSM